MIDAYWGAGARVAHEGESVYSRRRRRHPDRRADRPPGASTSTPTRPTPGSECAPFNVAGASDNTESVFDNGLPLARTEWIARRRRSPRCSRPGTRPAMTGQPVTPMIDNLVLEVDGGQRLGARTSWPAWRRGLLVTCLWYIREVDPQTMLLTGLTRDGVYLVEGGEITGAVNNFRWNESPIDLLNRFTRGQRDGAELQPGVGRRLLLAHGHAGAAHPRLQHVERLAGAVGLLSRASRVGPARDRRTRLVGLAGEDERADVEVRDRAVLAAYDVQLLPRVVAAGAR